MFFYNWQLSITLFWVVPVALAIILFAKKRMSNDFSTNHLDKPKVTEQIQKGLDTIQEIKSYN